MIAVNAQTGARIKGTYERLEACALATLERDADGTVSYDFDGESDVFWDGQETVVDAQDRPVFLDEDGCEVPETNVLFVCDGDCNGTCENPEQCRVLDMAASVAVRS